jgi:hypothetical protein
MVVIGCPLLSVAFSRFIMDVTWQVKLTEFTPNSKGAQVFFLVHAAQHDTAMIGSFMIVL